MIDGLKFGINSIAMALARVEPGFSSSSHGSIIALCFYYLEYALYQRHQTKPQMLGTQQANQASLASM